MNGIMDCDTTHGVRRRFTTSWSVATNGRSFATIGIGCIIWSESNATASGRGH